jgi:hypothetical protein
VKLNRFALVSSLLLSWLCPYFREAFLAISFDETGMRSSASNLAVLFVGFVGFIEYSLHINSLLSMYVLSARGLGIETDFPH